jgi:aspartate/tyrosine/aromatic aminotransferase
MSCAGPRTGTASTSSRITAACSAGLGLTEAQVNRLREEHGIYMVGDSRINIAGLNAKTVPILAAAIAQVI